MTDFISALVLGVAFGIALERAGLADARKLTGQFYGTDFVVFKVMFTAIVVCMIGLVVLGVPVYVVPTWLAPQVVGGLIFGVGFVMGGYCPGTGCAAAASGRVDGIALVGGLLAGTFVFGKVLPAFDGFYESTSRGTFTLPALLGLSPIVTAALVATFALVAFFGLERYESGRNHDAAPLPLPEA